MNPILEQARLRSQGYQPQPLTAPFLNEAGVPSFAPREASVIGARLSRGALRRGVVDESPWAIALNSLASYYAKIEPTRRAAPINENRDGVLLPSGERKLRSAMTGEDFVQALPESYLRTYTKAGVNFDGYSDLTFNEAERRFQYDLAIAEQSQLIEWNIDSVAERVVTGAAAFAAEELTDLKNYLTIGVGGSIAAKTPNAGGRAVANLLSRAGKGGVRTDLAVVATRHLSAGGIGVTAAGFDLIAQFSEQGAVNRFRSEGDSFHPDLLRAIFSGTAGYAVGFGLGRLLGGGTRIPRVVSEAEANAAKVFDPSAPTPKRLGSFRPLQGKDLDDDAFIEAYEDEFFLKDSRRSLPWNRNANWFDEQTEAGYKGRTKKDYADMLRRGASYEDVVEKFIPKDEAPDLTALGLRLAAVQKARGVVQDEIARGGERVLRRIEQLRRLNFSRGGGVLTKKVDLSDNRYRSLEDALRIGLARGETTTDTSRGFVVLKNGAVEQVADGYDFRVGSDGKIPLKNGKTVDAHEVFEVRDRSGGTVWRSQFADDPLYKGIENPYGVPWAKARELKDLERAERRIHQEARRLRNARAVKVRKAPPPETSIQKAVRKYDEAVDALIAAGQRSEAGSRLTTDEIDKLRTRVESAEARIRELTTGFPFNQETPLVREASEAITTRSRVNTGRLNPAQQADILHASEALGEIASPSSNGPGNAWQKLVDLPILGHVVKRARDFADLGTGKKTIRDLDDPLVNALAHLVSPFGFRVSSLVPDKHLPSFYARLHTLNRDMENMGLRTWYSLIGSKSQKELLEISRDAVRLAAGRQSKHGHPESQKIADELRDFFDSVRDKGVANGAMTHSAEDYVPIRLNPLVADTMDLVGDYHRWLVEKWSSADELHKGTLVRMGVLVREGEGFVFSENTGKVADKVFVVNGKLDKEALLASSEYHELLKSETGALMEEARSAINRRMNRAADSKAGNTKQFDGTKPTFFGSSDARFARKIDQEFWLQDHFIDNGLVETQIHQVLQGYSRGTGASVYFQDSINQMTGRQDINWAGLLQFTENRLKQDGVEEARRVVDLLDAKFKSLTQGGSPPDEEVGYISALIGNFNRTLVNPSIGLAVAHTELAAAFLDSAFGGNGHFGEAMKDLLKLLISSEARGKTLLDYGRALESIVAEHRIMPTTLYEDSGSISRTLSGRLWNIGKKVAKGEANTANPKTAGARRLLATLEGTAELGRTLGGEQWLTDTGRALVGRVTLRRTLRDLDKLEKLLSLYEGRPNFATNTEAQRFLKGAARKAGFGSDTRRVIEYFESGFADADTVRALKALRDAASDEQLHDVGSLRALASAGTTRENRQAMNRALDSLLDHAQTRVDNIITKGNPWDLATTADPLARLFNQFLTFPRAFRDGRMRSLFNGGVYDTAKWMAFYLAAEASLMNIRLITQGGHSPETLLEKWEEDPETMTIAVISRIPFLGPWGNSAFSAFDSLVGGTNGREPVSLGPGVGMLNRTISATNGAIRALATGEDVTPSQTRALERTLPGWNTIWLQIGRRLVEGLEAHSDR